MRFRLAAVVALAAPIAWAADPELLKPQYWQRLPEVSWVWVDHAGNPWFQTKAGDVAGSYHAATKTVPADRRVLLGDRRGRVWVTSPDLQANARYYDGKQWHDTEVKARKAFEDSAGRVFLLDTTHVHVFADGQWTSQRVFEKPSTAEGQFVEDAKGRTWFWALTLERRGRAGTRGAWVFDAGKWANLYDETGFPANDVAYLVPLADDRLIVVIGNRPPDRNYALWSPTRRIAEADRDPFAAFGPRRAYFTGTDPDGRHLFALDGVRPEPGEAWSRVRHAVVSRAGDVKLLPADWEEKAQRLHVGLYDNRQRVLTPLDAEPPPVPVSPGEAIARDGAGRVYFRTPPGVSVAWPKHEKPGDVLRVTKPSPVLDRIVQDGAGGVWGVPHRLTAGVALRRWDGKTWADTPVTILPHPRWVARPAPPWNGWPTGPFVFAGRGGVVLAVVVRDVYQLQPGEDLPADDVRAMAAIEARAKGKLRKYWFEGWLYRDGKWVGPTEVDRLLRDEWPRLVTAFADGPRRVEFFTLQADGERLWAAFGGKVVVLDRERAAEWTAPDANPQPALDHDRAAGLCPLPDGRLLHASAAKEGYQLHALAVADGKITAAEFPAPKWPERLYHWGPPAMRVAADRSLWLWLPSGGGNLDRVWVRRGDQWVERPDLGRPLFERDGAVWCLPGEGHTGGPNQHFAVVKGDATEVVALPAEYGHGYRPADVPGSSLMAAGSWLLTLDPAARKITRAVILNQYVPGGPAYRDGQGNIILPGGWFGAER